MVFSSRTSQRTGPAGLAQWLAQELVWRLAQELVLGTGAVPVVGAGIGAGAVTGVGAGVGAEIGAGVGVGAGAEVGAGAVAGVGA